MGKIDSEVADELPEIIAGKTYRISSAEATTTDVHDYKAVVVILESVPEGDAYNTMLWIQKTVSQRSKLGAFLSALGDNTDKWKDKVIEVVKWAEKDREIRIAK